LEVIHKTPFVASLNAFLDKDGSEGRVAVLKATYDIGDDGVLNVSEKQEPVAMKDEYSGEPAISSLLCENDGAYFKPGTDVVVIGSVYAPGGRPVRSLDASLSIADLSKTVRVFGDRIWSYTPGLGAVCNGPESFTQIPLCWEKAFGGVDTFHADPKKHAWEKRNPVGTGFRVHANAESLDGLPLPNFEDPVNLIARWSDKPVPQGFGFIGRSWMPRITYAGTYDEAWRKKRMPVPPADFDYRFFNAASPDLVHIPHLQGGEMVTAVNLSDRGTETFLLPALKVTFRGRARKTSLQLEGLLDTVVFKSDEHKLILVWRVKYSVSMNEPADAISAEVSFLS